MNLNVRHKDYRHSVHYNIHTVSLESSMLIFMNTTVFSIVTIPLLWRVENVKDNDDYYI